MSCSFTSALESVSFTYNCPAIHAIIYLIKILLIATEAIIWYNNYALSHSRESFSDSAFAAAGQLAVGAPQSNAQSARANNNGLAGIAADVDENAEVGSGC